MLHNYNYFFFLDSKVEWYCVTKDAADLFELSPLTNKEKVIISNRLSSVAPSKDERCIYNLVDYFFSKRWLFEKQTPVNKRWRILGKS
jgi:hypothetical protein